MKTDSNTSYVVNETPRSNSYEFGKAGNRFKLYFEDADDLQKQIDALKRIGIIPEEEIGE
jgi:hypothetical protein